MCTEFENSDSETLKGIHASHLFLISFLLAKVSLNDLKAFFIIIKHKFFCIGLSFTY